MSRTLRTIRIDGAIAFLPLTRGYVAVIDTADIPLVDGRNWCALVSRRRKAVYAARVQRLDGKPQMILLHRHLCGAKVGEEVDHEDCDGLNNRRSNLRFCTRSQNLFNTGVRSDNKSGFKGVFFDKRSGRWRAEIGTNGTSKYLGLFDTAGLASQARTDAAKFIHGEFARDA